MKRYQFEMDAIDSENFLGMLLNSINRYDLLILKELAQNNGEEWYMTEWYRKRQVYERLLYEKVTENILDTGEES